MDAKVFQVEMSAAQGCTWFGGKEAHPTKSLGIFVYGYRRYYSDFSRIELTHLEVHKVPTVETFVRSVPHRKISKITVLPEAFEGREEGLLAFGIVVQGRDDWQASGMVSDPGPSIWEEIVWEDNSHCPICKAGGKEVELVEEVFIVSVEDDHANGEHWGRVCPECDVRLLSNAPVPRGWGIEKLLPVDNPGVYGDEVMRGKYYLEHSLGIEDKDFPESGEKRVEMPQLNHFNRTSWNGTCMWAIPTLVLRDDMSWEIDLEIDAVSRIRAKLQEKGVKLNRDAKAVYKKLDWEL